MNLFAAKRKETCDTLSEDLYGDEKEYFEDLFYRLTTILHDPQYNRIILPIARRIMGSIGTSKSIDIVYEELMSLTLETFNKYDEKCGLTDDSEVNAMVLMMADILDNLNEPESADKVRKTVTDELQHYADFRDELIDVSD